jgi:peptidoglycan/xylan/chitin deacetylase (PgdA/CDA1 family)
MDLKGRIKSGLMVLDRPIVRWQLRVLGERPGLISLLCHSVFTDREEAHCRDLDPLEDLTLEDYERVFGHFRAAGYQFVGEEQVLAGLDPDGRFVWLTFDDGYYNNFRILPLIEKLKIPAQVYVSTDHVVEGKSFWWDALYRARSRQGWAQDEIYREAEELKSKTNRELEATLIREFGPNVLTPASDIDRPMTADEVRKFASHPLITVGNHTSEHGVLTNYSLSEARRIIEKGENELRRILGRPCRTFAYPNGDYSEEIFETLEHLGYAAAISCDFRRNSMASVLTEKSRYRIGRFYLSGGWDLEAQCQMLRAFFSPLLALRGAGLRARRRARRLCETR